MQSDTQQRDSLRVRKSRLEGRVEVSGAKNCALKLLAASILTDEPVELYNSPNNLLDMQVHLKMLVALGKEVVTEDKFSRITENDARTCTQLDWDARSIRNTLLILGALTTRFGEGRVPLPGGCKLGERKYDLHVMLLERLGAYVWEEDNYLCAKSVEGRLVGADIRLPIRSTGATENAILCGCLASGKTTVWNPHIRPEILDLVAMLRKMGAKITVRGQQSIEIEGVSRLRGVRHTVIPDNVEALTWAIGSVITGGDVEVMHFPFDHLETPLTFLRESGMKYYKGDDSLIVRGGTPYPIEISTGPYPGINSDMQPLFAIYGACSQGESKIIDLRFPGRYGYAEQMGKLGMAHHIDGDLLVIDGGHPLHGGRVTATDLRAGIALLLAGMVSEGEVVIDNAWQIARGYEDIQIKLDKLGVTVGRDELH